MNTPTQHCSIFSLLNQASHLSNGATAKNSHLSQWFSSFSHIPLGEMKIYLHLNSFLLCSFPLSPLLLIIPLVGSTAVFSSMSFSVFLVFFLSFFSFTDLHPQFIDFVQKWWVGGKLSPCMSRMP